MSCSELTVTIKDDDRTLKKSFLLYENYTVDETDPVIKNCIDETISEFQGEPDDVKVTIVMEI